MIWFLFYSSRNERKKKLAFRFAVEAKFASTAVDDRLFLREKRSVFRGKGCFWGKRVVLGSCPQVDPRLSLPILSPRSYTPFNTLKPGALSENFRIGLHPDHMTRRQSAFGRKVGNWGLNRENSSALRQTLAFWGKLSGFERRFPLFLNVCILWFSTP